MARVAGRARHAPPRARPPATALGLTRDVPRTFVALTLDAETRAAVAEQIEQLRPLSQAVAWVPAANLHVTLKFLGNQPEPRLDDIASALGEAAVATDAFAVTLHGLGGFPGMERPRILWVGAADGALAARALQERIEVALEARDFARDARPWHPHLTIGRVFDDRRWRREASASLRTAIAEAARHTFGRVPITSVSLMRSDLSPRGARYTEMASFALGAR